MQQEDEGCDCHFELAPVGEPSEPIAVVFPGYTGSASAWLNPYTFIAWTEPVHTNRVTHTHDPPYACDTSLFALNCLLLT